MPSLFRRATDPKSESVVRIMKKLLYYTESLNNTVSAMFRDGNVIIYEASKQIIIPLDDYAKLEDFMNAVRQDQAKQET